MANSTYGTVLEEQLQDPEFRERWGRLALARAVAIRLVAYRAEHGLTQSGLATQLGMKQSAISRLESGGHNPSMDTLTHLSAVLGFSFLVLVGPTGQEYRWINPEIDEKGVVERVTSNGSQALVLVE
jgi:transcriptional regulator with XRE-family HTH domain